MPSHILVVDDEPDILELTRFALSQDGFDVATAATGGEALEQLRRRRPDLVVLDLMLPDMSGKDVCRQLKADEETSNIPVMMVTARGEEVDRIIGFELGADDYVTKPFSIRELVLRVAAVLRRSSKRTQETSGNEVRSFGCLELDLDAHIVLVEGSQVPLTALEFRLLLTFMERKGRAQSRSTLLEDVWGMRGDSNTRTVDTHVKRLRQKLGAAGDYIQTLRGVGYRFRDRPPSA